MVDEKGSPLLVAMVIACLLWPRTGSGVVMHHDLCIDIGVSSFFMLSFLLI